MFITLLFADDQFIISDTEDNLQKAVYLLYNISKEYNLEIAAKKTKVFGFVGTDYLRTKIIINDEILEQVSQFTYLGCSVSYQFFNDVGFKLAKFLQLVGTIKRIIFKKLRWETISKVIRQPRDTCRNFLNLNVTSRIRPGTRNTNFLDFCEER